MSAVIADSHDLFGMKSIFDFTLNFTNSGVVSHNSIVVASVSELSHTPGSDGKFFPFKGAAVLNIHNVVPTDNHIEFTIDSGWSTPINIRVFFMIVNN